MVSDEDVKLIRARYIPYHPEHSASAIARDYGVSPACISDIIRGTRRKAAGAAAPVRGKDLASRLARRVDSSGGPNACWPWTGPTTYQGYGHICATEAGSKKQSPRTVHSVALELFSGGRPEGAYALHICDNPTCCNPAHLYWGTHEQNVADKVARDRCAKMSGEAHPLAKLTRAQVEELRARYIPRHPVHGSAAMSRELGLSESAVRRAITGGGWK